MALLPILHTQNQDLSLMQTKWASVLNPLLRNLLSKAALLTNIELLSGDNTINHLQDRPLQGYFVVGMQGGYAQIFDKPSPMPSLTLILNSSAPVTVSLMVF